MIVSALLPRHCFGCEREGSLLCDQCLADTSLDGPPFAYANPIVRQLICAWKYDGDANAFQILHRLVAPRLALLRSIIEEKKIVAIVPVPLSTWKERWRGFSQSRDLARLLGAELHLPVVDILDRKHRLRAQANLSHDVRKSALKRNPFSVKEGAELPTRILLIDDVETTGATMNAVEEVLLANGVDVIVKWSLAKG